MTKKVPCREKKKERKKERFFLYMTNALKAGRDSKEMFIDKEKYLNIVLRKQNILWCFALLISLLYFGVYETGAQVPELHKFAFVLKGHPNLY